MSSSLFDTLRYTKERVGLVTKDGKTYVKYRKVRRFKKNRDLQALGLRVFGLVVLALGLIYLLK